MNASVPATSLAPFSAKPQEKNYIHIVFTSILYTFVLGFVKHVLDVPHRCGKSPVTKTVIAKLSKQVPYY